MTILLATNNPHKVEEIRAIFAPIEGVAVTTLGEVGYDGPEPVEDGTTLEENAWIKAKEIHEATGLPVVADDTGLEVTALDGAPGVWSARYAGDDATYEDNCRKLVAALDGADDRTARFRTVICYVDELRTLFAEGEVAGVIEPEGRGDEGFGYDPIFRPEEQAQTFAEMSDTEKNQISHRGRAVRNFATMLTDYLPDGSLPEEAAPTGTDNSGGS